MSDDEQMKRGGELMSWKGRKKRFEERSRGKKEKGEEPNSNSQVSPLVMEESMSASARSAEISARFPTNFAVSADLNYHGLSADDR